MPQHPSPSQEVVDAIEKLKEKKKKLINIDGKMKESGIDEISLTDPEAEEEYSGTSIRYDEEMDELGVCPTKRPQKGEWRVWFQCHRI